MTRLKICSLAIVILSLVGLTPLWAQSDEDIDSGSRFTLSANAAIVSDYRFRGISLSDRNPAIQSGIDVSMDNGLFVGSWASTVADTGGSNRDLDRLIDQSDLMINCDSIGMIRRIGEWEPGRAIGIRVNPGLGTGYGDSALLTYAGTKTTKFGIYREQWAEALAMARTFDLKIETLHFHVGCGYLDGELESWNKAVTAALSCLLDLPDLTTVNVGGGLGLPHREGDRPLDLTRWSSILRSHFADSGLTIAVEPGDFLVKDAGILVLGVTDVEKKRDTLFVSVDGGFNLHPEPAFYDLPCEPVACWIRSRDPADWQSATIAGNINEALDIWGEAVSLPPLAEEDFIALINAGGYGAAMSSNHCMRGDFTEMAV